MQTAGSVAAVGWDSHRKFSQVTLRDAAAGIVQRMRIGHDDRGQRRRTLARWPAQTPVVLEARFGWSWVADELTAPAAAMWKHQQDYSPVPPLRPGARPRRGAPVRAAAAAGGVPRVSDGHPRPPAETALNRPGTGQPECPMVPVASTPRQA